MVRLQAASVPARTNLTLFSHWKASLWIRGFDKNQQTRGEKHLSIQHKYISKSDSWVAFYVRSFRSTTATHEQMMMCGVYKLRVFFIRFLAVLELTSFRDGEVNAFSVVRSTTPNGGADVDTFSNADPSCRLIGCTQVRGSDGCNGGDCCSCRCSRNAPNYLIHRKICVTNDDIEGKGK